MPLICAFYSGADTGRCGGRRLLVPAATRAWTPFVLFLIQFGYGLRVQRRGDLS